MVVPEEEQSQDPLRVPLPRQRVLQVEEGRGRAHERVRCLHRRADRDGQAASDHHHRQVILTSDWLRWIEVMCSEYWPLIGRDISIEKSAVHKTLFLQEHQEEGDHQ